MFRQPIEPLGVQKSVTLKLGEAVVDSNNPWVDDLLARQDIAKRLTNFVENQEPPLTISPHGQWGTGKTFMLRRWQKALENQSFRAIYFNAWEDDFCDDPLLAIVGQLSEYFKEDGLRAIAGKVVHTAIPLILKNAPAVIKMATGITLDVGQIESSDRDFLKEYLHERATKDNLKNHLGELSAKVASETNHPLVFIIDELDRCRPNFAIELLERVKHIFDVPNLVFVFGINRTELCKSLASVYGDINTDVYLRRFFDFELNLPEADSRGFATQLIDRFQIADVFHQLAEAAHDRVHMQDYDNYRTVFPMVWSALGISLRDIDYGIRLLALLARNVPLGAFTHPFLLAVLIAMKFKKPEFYHSLKTGDFRTSEIMDYIDDEASRRILTDEDLSRCLDRIEGFLYCADITNRGDQQRGENAHTELSRLAQGDVEFGFQVVSRRAQNADPEHFSRIIRAIEDGQRLGITGDVFGDLATLIDAYQMQLRR